MTQGLIQTLLVRLPMAYIMSIQPNASLTKIGLAAPVSTAVGIMLNVGFYVYLNRKKYPPATAATGITTTQAIAPKIIEAQFSNMILEFNSSSNEYPCIRR